MKTHPVRTRTRSEAALKYLTSWNKWTHLYKEVCCLSGASMKELLSLVLEWSFDTAKTTTAGRSSNPANMQKLRIGPAASSLSCQFSRKLPGRFDLVLTCILDCFKHRLMDSDRRHPGMSQNSKPKAGGSPVLHIKQFRA